jgi:ring-1,2-phenylacetyl-CoA epoxidase subunit PaaE
MSKFHPLPIARVDRETRDAVAITFAVPDALADQFRWEQGQHLTLRADIGGEDLRRSYSICSAVQDGALRIAVKKSPGGAFSTWANDALKAGDTIDVMPPLGHFNVPLDAGNRRHYLGFAAGSGITPLLSIVKTTLAVEPRSRFTLVYGNRASGTVMFKEELAALKDLYLDRFNLVHVLSREAQDIELLHGRIDRAKADALLSHWVPLPEIDTAFVCGPDGMMQAVADALRARGFPEAKIKIERFAASIPKHEHVVRHVAAPGHTECEVTVLIDGSRRTFTLEKGKENILDAGLANGVELPYSCKGGVCSTCRCRLTEGEVDMDVNFALEDYEVARGFILSCQSYPVTDKVTVDFDQTGTG